MLYIRTMSESHVSVEYGTQPIPVGTLLSTFLSKIATYLVQNYDWYFYWHCPIKEQ